MGSVSAAAIGMAMAGVRAETKGQAFPGEHYPSWMVDKTGVRIWELTPGDAQDSVTYQTHAMWISGMAYLMFSSTRGGQSARPCLLQLQSGEVKPLPVDHGVNAVLSWHSPSLYFINGRDLFHVDAAEAFTGAQPKRIGSLPAALKNTHGSIGLDADQKTLYVGGSRESEDDCALYGIDTVSGEARHIVDVPFLIGHVQANPTVPGLVMFCHETGGDAPQRTWFVHAGQDGKPQPFMKELREEWVTHEAWWGPDRIIFTVWPYDDIRKAQPHGIACTTLEAGPKGEMRVLAQYPAWHTHGSPDGRWAVGDDFDRNIWIVDVETLDRRLLTQGHNGEGFNTHPHPSFTPDNRGVLFNSSRGGKETICYAQLPETWKELPKP